MWKHAFMASTNPYIKKMGEMMYIPTTWDDYYVHMPKCMTENYGLLTSSLWSEEEGNVFSYSTLFNSFI